MEMKDDVRLTIVIPALNEAEAIGSTIQRCLDAREAIISETGVTHVGIVVVSDGSTDGTVEIAQEYQRKEEDVSVIVFEKNRGYGAAIKEGWREGGGDLLAFLDADGTCDPKYFIPMCKAALDEEVNVVLGNRMGPSSQMPTVRRIGNTMFAILLGLLSRRRVTDTASGMRVIRSDSLGRLLPLPDRLEFTPSMSARTLMDETLSIKEVPMEYAERVGASKLRAFRDGLRFTRVILSAVVYIKPSRLTTPIALALALLCLVMAVSPTRYYIAHRVVQEGTVYRFLAILMLGVMIVTLLCTTVIAEHMGALSQLRYEEFLRKNRSWWGRYFLRVYLTIGAVLLIVGVVLVWPGIVSYVQTGKIPPTTLHWSSVVVTAFFVLALWEMLATACILRIVSGLHDRQRFLTGRD